MSPERFWFAMICLVILLDLMAWRERRRIDKGAQDWWKARDAESRRRHDEFMTAMRREAALDQRGAGEP